MHSRELLGAALVCLGLTLALYAPALGLYFHGDDIWFLHPNPHWLRDALAPTGTFHYYPLNQILLYLLPAMTGRRPEVMHALNLLVHAGVGLALYAWLRRLGPDWRACGVASIFYVSRGINYEVVTWVTELSYLMVLLLSLLTLSWWHAYLESMRSKYWIWTVGGFAVALLIFEHALVLLPLYFVFELIFHPGQSLGRHVLELGRVPWRVTGARLWKDTLRYAPFIVIVVAFLGMKYSHRHGLTWSSIAGPAASAAAPMPSGEAVMSQLPAERRWHGMLNAPRRATLDLLLSTGYLFLPSGLSYGGEDHWLTRHGWWCLLPWLAVQLVLFWKGGPLARFLLIWVYAYMLPLAAAGVPQARYYTMAAVPAAALVGLGWLAAWHGLRRRLPAVVTGALLVGGLVAVVAGEAVFIRMRLAEWKLASDLLRRTVALLQRDLDGETREVYLLDVPRLVPGRYFPAFAFSNAAEYLNLMVRPPRPQAKTLPVYDRSFVEGRWPTIGQYMSRDTLRAKLAQPGVLVYEFVGRSPWVTELRE